MDSEPLKNANLIQEESNRDFKDFQKKTSKKTIYIISGIILLVVIVTVVLVVLLTKPNDEDKPKPRSLLEKLKSKNSLLLL